MVTYSINWMGPINSAWIDEHGSCWSAGRIDIRDDSKIGYEGWSEYALSPMHNTSWALLSDWLDDLETSEIVGFYRLIEMFETQTRHKIVWLYTKNEGVYG